MPIEFNCPFCSKVLKTADEKAGMSAKCPGCGQVLVVPGLPGYSTAPVDDPTMVQPRDTGFADVPPEYGGQAPAGGPAPEATRACPMCGGQIRPEARVCRHCGERVAPERAAAGSSGGPFTGELVPTEVDAGTVLKVSWELMKEHMGMAIVGTLLPQMALSFVMIIAYLAGIFLAFLLSGGRRVDPDVITVVMIPIALLLSPLMLFITAGQIRFMLAIARGESPQIVELVKGGPYVLRAFGVMILFSLMSSLGMLCFCVGSLAVAVIFGPCFHTLVDRDCGVIESLDLTRKFTMVNIGPQVLLLLATMAIMMLSGICTLGVANVVTLPYIMLVQAVAYKMMTGQPVGRGKP